MRFPIVFVVVSVWLIAVDVIATLVMHRALHWGASFFEATFLTLRVAYLAWSVPALLLIRRPKC